MQNKENKPKFFEEIEKHSNEPYLIHVCDNYKGAIYGFVDNDSLRSELKTIDLNKYDQIITNCFIAQRVNLN